MNDPLAFLNDYCDMADTAQIEDAVMAIYDESNTESGPESAKKTSKKKKDKNKSK